MALALFDLDDTLIAGDSDHAWGEFLVHEGVVEPIEFGRINEQFYQDYRRGELDIDAYLSFALAPLKGVPEVLLQQWHNKFMRNRIEPMLLSAAIKLLRLHREGGDTCVIITSTNEFVTAPIARRLGVEHLIASRAERDESGYTGKSVDTPSYREGKIIRLQAWLDDRPESLEGSWFYSDSHNDLPLLELVDNPVAVDPDDTLRAAATDRGWQIISLRN